MFTLADKFSEKLKVESEKPKPKNQGTFSYLISAFRFSLLVFHFSLFCCSINLLKIQIAEDAFSLKTRSNTGNPINWGEMRRR